MAFQWAIPVYWEIASLSLAMTLARRKSDWPRLRRDLRQSDLLTTTDSQAQSVYQSKSGIVQAQRGQPGRREHLLHRHYDAFHFQAHTPVSDMRHCGDKAEKHRYSRARAGYNPVFPGLADYWLCAPGSSPYQMCRPDVRSAPVGQAVVQG